jgi:hypothetical protein
MRRARVVGLGGLVGLAVASALSCDDVDDRRGGTQVGPQGGATDGGVPPITTEAEPWPWRSKPTPAR